MGNVAGIDASRGTQMIDGFLVNFRNDQAIEITRTISFGQKQAPLDRAEAKPDESSSHRLNPFH